MIASSLTCSCATADDGFHLSDWPFACCSHAARFYSHFPVWIVTQIVRLSANERPCLQSIRKGENEELNETCDERGGNNNKIANCHVLRRVNPPPA